MNASVFMTFGWPSLLLLAGVVDDLRSQKIHNSLIIALLTMTLGLVLFHNGWSGLKTGGLGSAVALGLMFPLFMARIVGGGDVKLMFVFGFATSLSISFNVVIFSLVWGAILGLLQALFSGRLLQLLQNTVTASHTKPGELSGSHSIPYSVAMLFGWFSHLSYLQWGGRLW